MSKQSSILQAFFQEELRNYGRTVDDSSFTTKEKAYISRSGGKIASSAADGSTKTNQYFYEELRDLDIPPKGILGISMCELQSNKGFKLPTYAESAPSASSIVKMKETLRAESEPRCSATHLADMTAGCELEESPKSGSTEDSHSLFLSNLHNRDSFRARIPATKLGLLYTDAASSVLTKSFLQRSLYPDNHHHISL